MNPVYDVSYLDPVDDNPFAGQQTPPPPPLHVDGEDDWYLDKILDS